MNSSWKKGPIFKALWLDKGFYWCLKYTVIIKTKQMKSFIWKANKGVRGYCDNNRIRICSNYNRHVFDGFPAVIYWGGGGGAGSWRRSIWPSWLHVAQVLIQIWPPVPDHSFAGFWYTNCCMFKDIIQKWWRNSRKLDINIFLFRSSWCSSSPGWWTTNKIKLCFFTHPAATKQ